MDHKDLERGNKFEWNKFEWNQFKWYQFEWNYFELSLGGLGREFERMS